jgi:hypothetical protein
MNADDQNRKDAIDNVAANLDQWRRGVDVRFDAVEEALAQNTKATNTIKSNTDELVDILNSWRGAMKVFEFIGKIAKPIGALVTFFLALWAAWPAKK